MPLAKIHVLEGRYDQGDRPPTRRTCPKAPGNRYYSSPSSALIRGIPVQMKPMRRQESRASRTISRSLPRPSDECTAAERPIRETGRTDWCRAGLREITRVDMTRGKA